MVNGTLLLAYGTISIALDTIAGDNTVWTTPAGVSVRDGGVYELFVAGNLIYVFGLDKVYYSRNADRSGT